MILIVGLTGCGSDTGKEAAKTVTLKLSLAPSAGNIYGQGYAEFAKYVEEESKGQIKIQILQTSNLAS